MTIEKIKENDKLTFKIEGSVDYETEPKLREEVFEDLSDVKTLYFDFSDMDYISSVGLRLILEAYKIMISNGGKVILAHIDESIVEVFRLTGFFDLMEVEE